MNLITKRRRRFIPLYLLLLGGFMLVLSISFVEMEPTIVSHNATASAKQEKLLIENDTTTSMSDMLTMSINNNVNSNITYMKTDSILNQEEVMMDNSNSQFHHHQHHHQNQQQNFFYSETRTDRYGSSILDMIYAKAYAFHHHGLDYKGACSKHYHAKEKQSKTVKLLTALGLNKVFQFECPHKVTKERNDTTTSSSQILDGSIYRRDEFLTPEFLAYLRSLRHNQQSESEQRRPEVVFRNKNSTNRLSSTLASEGDDSSNVVVHIRRGDVTPCLKAGKSHYRYTPNSLYLNVLEDVMKNYSSEPKDVTIFSEKKSTESFDEFTRRGYNLRLDGALTTAWLRMADAKILILSKSAFSRVPALLNSQTVIYIPMWHRPVSGWKIVDRKILDNATEDWKLLCMKHCTSSCD